MLFPKATHSQLNELYDRLLDHCHPEKADAENNLDLYIWKK